MAKANARHILVSSEEESNCLKQQIIDGADFAEMVSVHFQCPSGKQGGDPGSFSPGQMVPEFDTAVLKETVGDVHGSVKTQFGCHLIEITSRNS